jgi:hypothetical protein
LSNILIASFFLFLPLQSRADFWGGDLPLLAEIVFNTLHTMSELERQTKAMNDQMDGIKDRIQRIQTIADIVQPSSWNQWKDPKEALIRLRSIYQTIPKEYRSEKYDMIEEELANAMNLVARIDADTRSSFQSGKELERHGADASPGVAEKLTASGIGTLIAQEAQSQVIQSHITSLLSQMLADANEKETRAVVTRGTSYRSFAANLGQNDFKFSRIVLALKGNQ